MIAVATFSTAGGLNFSYPYYDRETSVELRQIEGVATLANQEAIMADDSLGYYVVSRRSLGGRHLTWIGICRSLPQRWRARPNEYCGVGMWLMDTGIDGYAAVEFLNRALSNLLPEIDASSGFASASSTIAPAGQAKKLERHEWALQSGQGLAAHLRDMTVAFPRVQADDVDRIAELITVAQLDPGLQAACKVLIPLDEKAERNLRAGRWSKPLARDRLPQRSADPSRSASPEAGSGDPHGEWAVQPRRRPIATIPATDPRLPDRVHVELRQRVDQLEADLPSLRQWTLGAGAAACVALLLAIPAIGIAVMAWTAEPLPPPRPPSPIPGLRDLPSQPPPPPPLRPELPAEPAPIQELGADAEFYGRLETTLRSLGDLIDQSGPPSPEGRKRLQRPYQALVDAFANSSDRALKTIGEKARKPSNQRPP